MCWTIRKGEGREEKNRACDCSETGDDEDGRERVIFEYLNENTPLIGHVIGT